MELNFLKECFSIAISPINFKLDLIQMVLKLQLLFHYLEKI